ncbi:MAG: flagellar export protein FliJ [Spirochaetota bacterium]
MKQFQFPLESVLKVRKMQVEEKLSEFAKIAGMVNRLKGEIDANKKSISHQLRDYNRAASPGGNLNNLRTYEAYIKSLYIKNQNLTEKINDQQDSLEEARKNLIEARKNAEVLEILKSKQEKSHQERIQRAEKIEEEESNEILHKNKTKEKADESQQPYEGYFFKKDTEPVWIPEEKPKSEYEKLEEFANSLDKKR